MRRNVLVAQTRMPELDRDRGSERVDAMIRYLLEAGWSVTFLADEANADPRHARRLRQLGVATFAGFDQAGSVIAEGRFDLALVAFWQQSARLLPLLRRLSPDTRVIVDSIDVHFLREARQRFGVDGALDPQFGVRMTTELNTYHAADAVLTVSTKEAELLGDLLGPGRVHFLALGEETARSAVPLDLRQGMVFVGNFRHLPNGEAVEWLCRDVLPRLDPALLAQHPFSVIGNRLDEKIRAHAVGLPDVRMVGWVPSIVPYLHQARLSVVPLLHGAGVKGKVVQSMMVGTPVVTTHIGAEGLDLVAGVHAAVADDAPGLAAAISRLLVDDDAWHAMSEAGAEHVATNHDPEAVRTRFHEVIEHVLSSPPPDDDRFRHGRDRAGTYRREVAGMARAVHEVTDPATVVLVASRGDDALIELDGRQGQHFPQGADGGWAGYHPADSEAAVAHLEALRQRGADYLVLPSSAFWWLHHYDGLAAHLDASHRRVRSDEHAVVYDLRSVAGHTPRPVTASSTPGERQGVVVLGTFSAGAAGPPAALSAELARSAGYRVVQRWSTAEETGAMPTNESVDLQDDVAWVVHVDDRAVLPSGFLDDLLALLDEVGAERGQPSHAGRPEAGPPMAERLRGSVAREVDGWLPLPVRVVRAGAQEEGPVLLVDSVTVGLARPLAADDVDRRVLDVFVAGDSGPVRTVRRGALPKSPRLSVLVATYDRPELLAACLDAFADQAVDPSEVEIVVVDDGSPGDATEAVLAARLPDLPIVSARIAHAGRSAAKNLAVMLARGEIVLFFDDDDRPAPDLLAEHLRAHEELPDDATAVLGYTGWAPELSVTPFMHYLTDIDKLLFAYGNLTDGQQLDWRGFWEGRISCKRRLLVGHGLHDQRLDYSIDMEMAWRLARQGLKVVYRSAARSHMSRTIDLEQFCARAEAKGRSQALMAGLHPEPEMQAYTKVAGAAERWAAAASRFDADVDEVRRLEAELRDGDDPTPLYLAYRRVQAAAYDKGLAGVSSVGAPAAAPPTTQVTPPPVSFVGERRDVELVGQQGGSHRALVRAPGSVPPATEDAAILTVTIPVWSRTQELADMVERTISTLWEVARVPTQVVVIDNGSPHFRDLPAEVYRFERNEGVSVAWNAGLRLGTAPAFAVLNSDCVVTPGWDEALLEAAADGRRIVFPYTDHADGLGFRTPDQAGTAGWCFMLTREIFEEVGDFDEQFSPAYCEDTDYWHRAWELGIELTPVPAARVSHARRTTGRTDPHVDWLLQSHRYKYGWKHGVDPLRAPPYYQREYDEFVGRCR